MRILWGILRVAFAAAAVAAIVGQLIRSTQLTVEASRNVALMVTNFFSYFTIASNVLTVIVLLMGAFFLFTRKGDDTHWFTVLRVVLVTYMGVTGIVYNTLLRGVEVAPGATVEWSNTLLHVVGPIFVVLDWFFAPGRIPVSYWRTIRVVVIFPIVWAAYTLIRGPLTPNEITGATYWYPYPFLDPHLSPNGYTSVAFYVVMIAMLIGLVAAGAIYVSRRKIVRILPGQPQPDTAKLPPA